ncbi:MAG: hypothetical protein GC192_01340 [Bacteroidetes bacterium]|nr:hypothetical protein [Bacteroidota bacterium]
MKTKFYQYLFAIIFTIYTLSLNAQIASNGNNLWYAKEFSKEEALYQSKNFLFEKILGASTEVVQFEVIPLAASSSGELTTLLYKCESKQKEGLILGFYGNYWNDAGVIYQGFAFKNFEKNQAVEFLNKIQVAIKQNSKFLNDEKDNNNIYFRYDDVDVLIWSAVSDYSIRLFWNGFDSTWERVAFDRSKKRFEKKI